MGGMRSRFTLQGTDMLRQRAMEKIRLSAERTRKNCFISFDHEDERAVDALRMQAKDENSALNFRDYSVKEPFNSRKAEYIKRKIRDKLHFCSTTVVYCTDKTAKSKWVDWEIKTSLERGKRVICVHKQGDKPSRLPPAARGAKVKVIPWSVKAIQKEIEG